MITPERIALNPLPWLIGTDGQWHLSREVLETAYPVALAAGFRAVSIDVPAGMSTGEYQSMLTDFTLEAAPGYFAAAFHDNDALTDILEAARRHVDVHLELGQPTTFLASDVAEVRFETPAVGAAADETRLAVITSAIEHVAELMYERGVTPCLHPHVGTWIETEQEVEAVLRRISEEVLAFGPDTGHLYWGGMDPAEMVTRHARRVGAVHIKDAHQDRIAAARADGLGYMDATMQRKIWAEPGRGDVGLRDVFDALPQDFTGWCVVEVDVPDLEDAEASTMYSGSWIAAEFGERS